MELAQIRYFLALCETRNFTQAAKHCGVSQPSLSNAIKALEGELGSALFQRSPFSLTPVGKAILPHFRGALRHIRQARKAGTMQSHRTDALSLPSVQL